MPHLSYQARSHFHLQASISSHIATQLLQSHLGKQQKSPNCQPLAQKEMQVIGAVHGADLLLPTPGDRLFSAGSDGEAHG